MAKNRAPRYHNFTCQMSYYYYIHDGNGNVVNNITEEDWKNMICSKIETMVTTGPYTYIVFIFHDRDKDKDGNPKGLHVHMILHRDSDTTESVFRNEWEITRTQDGGCLRNQSHAYRYLLHVTDKAMNEKKYMYPKSDIRVINRDNVKFDLDAMFVAKKKDDTSVTDKKDELHEAVLTGSKTCAEIRAIYARDKELGLTAWSKDRKSYEADTVEYLNAMNFFFQSNNACKTTIFVTGGGGSEKTTLAQNVIAPMFADNRGVHVPAAPMGRVTYDPIGTYQGERVSVLNEIRGTSWILEGFCECLDPIHSGLSGARYRDKAYFPDVVLMTTSDTRETFIRDMFLKWINAAEGRGTAGDKLRLSYATKWEVVNGERSCNYDFDAPCLGTIPSATHPRTILFENSVDSIWDKLWQVRRRIPILIELDANHPSGKKMATISVLDYSKPTRLIGDKSSAVLSYQSYAPIEYSTTDSVVIEAFRAALNAAIAYYYTVLNQFTINPYTVKRPVLEI